METRKIEIDIDARASASRTEKDLNDLSKLLSRLFDEKFDLDIDSSAISDVIKEANKFPDSIESKLDFDDSGLKSAISDANSFPDQLNSRVNVDDSSIDSAIRKKDDLNATTNLKAKVDDSAISQACGNIEKELEQCASNGLSDGFKSFAADAGSFAANAGIGIGIGASIREGLEREASVDLLQGALGLTEEEAARAGAASQANYLDAWGDTPQQLNTIFQDLGEAGLVDFANDSEESLAQIQRNVVDLGNVMEADQTEVINAVQRLYRSGLVESADEAFDLIAAAQQRGGNIDGELLDTIREYSINFAEAGLTGEQFFTGIIQASQSGTFSIDKFGDAFKEAPVAMNDLINNTKELDDISGRLGVSSENFTTLLQDGLEGNEGALITLIGLLQNVEDEADQFTAIEAILGSPGEDFSRTAVELLDLNAGLGETSQAMESLSDTVNDNTLTSLTEARREFTELFIQLGTAFLPVLEALLPVFTSIVGGISAIIEKADQLGILTPIVTALGAAFALKGFTSILSIVSSLTGLGGTAGTVATKLIPFGGTLTKLSGALTKIGPLFTKFGSLLLKGFSVIGRILPLISKFALAIGPAGLIAAAVIAIGILIFKNWDKIKEFLSNLWDNIKRIASKAWDGIKSVFSNVLKGISAVFRFYINIYRTILSTAWKVIRAVISRAWDGIKSVFSRAFIAIRAVFNFYINIYKKILSTAWNAIKAVASAAWNGIKTAITTPIQIARDLITGIVDRIKSILGFSGAKDAVTSTFNGIKDAILAPLRFARDQVQAIVDRIKGSIDSVTGAISSVGGFLNPFAAVGGVHHGGQGVTNFFAGGGIHKTSVGRGMITQRPTMITSEFGHTEAIVPEFASVNRIEDILGQTNILRRLYARFRERESAATNTVNNNRSVTIAPTVNINGGMPTGSDGSQRLRARQLGRVVGEEVFKKSRSFV